MTGTASQPEEKLGYARVLGRARVYSCQYVLYFCHSEAASAAEESTFLGFSATCSAVPAYPLTGCHSVPVSVRHRTEQLRFDFTAISAKIPLLICGAPVTSQISPPPRPPPPQSRNGHSLA